MSSLYLPDIPLSGGSKDDWFDMIELFLLCFNYASDEK